MPKAHGIPNNQPSPRYMNVWMVYHWLTPIVAGTLIVFTMTRIAILIREGKYLNFKVCGSIGFNVNVRCIDWLQIRIDQNKEFSYIDDTSSVLLTAVSKPHPVTAYNQGVNAFVN